MGVKLCSWIDILERQKDNFSHALEQIRVGQSEQLSRSDAAPTAPAAIPIRRNASRLVISFSIAESQYLVLMMQRYEKIA